MQIKIILDSMLACAYIYIIIIIYNYIIIYIIYIYIIIIYIYMNTELELLAIILFTKPSTPMEAWPGACSLPCREDEEDHIRC